MVLFDMKRFIFVVIIIILILFACLLSYFKFFGFSTVKETSKSDGIIPEAKIIYWKSYLRETFDDESNKVVDSSNNSNYYIEMDDISMNICTFEPSNCDIVKYIKKNNKYTIYSNKEKILNANLTVEDGVDDTYGTIIKIIKTYDDEVGGYSVFYFRRVNKESVK